VHRALVGNLHQPGALVGINWMLVATGTTTIKDVILFPTLRPEQQ